MSNLIHPNSSLIDALTRLLLTAVGSPIHELTEKVDELREIFLENNAPLGNPNRDFLKALKPISQPGQLLIGQLFLQIFISRVEGKIDEKVFDQGFHGTIPLLTSIRGIEIVITLLPEEDRQNSNILHPLVSLFKGLNKKEDCKALVHKISDASKDDRPSMIRRTAEVITSDDPIAMRLKFLSMVGSYFDDEWKVLLRQMSKILAGATDASLCAQFREVFLSIGQQERDDFIEKAKGFIQAGDGAEGLLAVYLVVKQCIDENRNDILEQDTFFRQINDAGKRADVIALLLMLQAPLQNDEITSAASLLTEIENARQRKNLLKVFETVLKVQRGSLIQWVGNLIGGIKCGDLAAKFLQAFATLSKKEKDSIVASVEDFIQPDDTVDGRAEIYLCVKRATDAKRQDILDWGSNHHLINASADNRADILNGMILIPPNLLEEAFTSLVDLFNQFPFSGTRQRILSLIEEVQSKKRALFVMQIASPLKKLIGIEQKVHFIKMMTLFEPQEGSEGFIQLIDRFLSKITTLDEQAAFFQEVKSKSVKMRISYIEEMLNRSDSIMQEMET